jgi:hypothetical protein
MGDPLGSQKKNQIPDPKPLCNKKNLTMALTKKNILDQKKMSGEERLRHVLTTLTSHVPNAGQTNTSIKL